MSVLERRILMKVLYLEKLERCHVFSVLFHSVPFLLSRSACYQLDPGRDINFLLDNFSQSSSHAFLVHSFRVNIA